MPIDPGIDAYPDGAEGWFRERADEAFGYGISRERAIALLHEGYNDAEHDHEAGTTEETR